MPRQILALSERYYRRLLYGCAGLLSVAILCAMLFLGYSAFSQFRERQIGTFTSKRLHYAPPTGDQIAEIRKYLSRGELWLAVSPYETSATVVPPERRARVLRFTGISWQTIPLPPPAIANERFVGITGCLQVRRPGNENGILLAGAVSGQLVFYA